jgi:putative hydrolase of the HAD superfamily
MSSRRHDAVLFDVGGVLVQLSGVPTMMEWTRQRYSVPELFHRWLMSPVVRAFETGRSDADTFARGVVAELDLPVEPAEFLAFFETWPRGAHAGAVDLVRELRAVVRLACLSNTNAIHWRRIAAETGLLEHFHHVLASHEIGLLKPDREAFDHAVAVLGCDASRILFLEDNPTNVAAARTVGLDARFAPDASAARVVLEELGLVAARRGARGADPVRSASGGGTLG